MSNHRGVDRLLALAAAQPLDVPCDSFHFLRHGQTARNALRIFQDLDEPLDATGLAQAHRAAATLQAERFGTLACSPLPRARTTAERVAAARAAAGHMLTPQPHDGLRERHFGELIGTSSVQIDWNCAPAGGETLPEFVARARAGLAWALAQPGPVLVVAHGGTLYVLAGMLGVPLSAALLANAHPLRFARTDGCWAVQALQPTDPHATNNLS